MSWKIPGWCSSSVKNIKWGGLTDCHVLAEQLHDISVSVSSCRHNCHTWPIPRRRKGFEGRHCGVPGFTATRSLNYIWSSQRGCAVVNQQKSEFWDCTYSHFTMINKSKFTRCFTSEESSKLKFFSSPKQVVLKQKHQLSCALTLTWVFTSGWKELGSPTWAGAEEGLQTHSSSTLRFVSWRLGQIMPERVGGCSM